MPRTFTRNRLRTSDGRMKLVATLLDFAAKNRLTELEPLLRIAELEAPVSKATLRRWIDRFLQSGKSGLDPSPRKDRGTIRTFHNRWPAMVIVAELHSEGKKIGEIHRELLKLWANLYPTSKPPSEQTVRRYVY